MTTTDPATGDDPRWRGLDAARSAELLRDLIRAASPNPPGDETAVAAVLAGALRELGFAPEVEEFAPRRFNVLARVQGAGVSPALVFSAHMDTLPAGTGEWTHPPFGGEKANGRIYGRGACDMKSGIVAMISAALHLRRESETGAPPAGDLILAFTGGESSSCLGARRLVETRALSGAGAILVSEPSSLDVLTAEKAALWFRVTARGVAGHLSGEGQTGVGGKSAIDAMIRLLDEIGTILPSDRHPLLGGATVNTGTIAGGTAINLVPDRCVAEIDFRLLPHHDPDALEVRLRSLAGAGVEVERLDFKPAVDTPHDAPIVRIALEETAAVRGVSVQPQGVAYFSDACVLSPAFDLPMVIIGPGALGGSGGLDESCSLADVATAATIYARIGRRFLGG